MTSDFTIQFDHGDATYRIRDTTSASPEVKYNLTKLFERKKGTIFRAVEGKLVEVDSWLGWLSYLWNRKAEEEKVRVVIDKALGHFDDLLMKMERRSGTTASLAARFLFDEKGSHGMGRLSKTLYSRQLIRSDNTLSKLLTSKDTIRLKIGDNRFFDLSSSKFAGLDHPFVVDMDLGNEVQNHNLAMLLRRQKGEIYTIDNEGKLQRQCGCCQCANRSELDQKVGEVVESVLNDLNVYCGRHIGSQVHHLVMEKIFCPGSPFSNLNKRIFDRSKIDEDAALIELLSPNYRALKEEHVQALIDVRDAVTTAQLEAAKMRVDRALQELTAEMTRLSSWLGIELKKIGDGGSGGARAAYDLYNHKISVVKPGDEGPYGDNNPKWYAKIKRFILSPRACLEGMSEPMAEVDSWLWDRTFGIWAVPPTEIRYVYSRDFVGSHYKECSVQLWVHNGDKPCKTLGEYVGISPKVYWYPRRFLRWLSGGKEDLGPFSFLWTRNTRRERLLEKVPEELLEKVALLDFGTENIDCHFENILVKESPVPEEETLLDRIFNQDTTVTDEEIRTWVNSGFFCSQKNQEVLDHLLDSRTVTVGGVKRKVTLVKHDGGSSNPKKHPSRWDFFSLRFKHLFEILPHFEGKFSDEVATYFDDEEKFADFLLEKASRNLSNKMNPKVSEEFWKHEENATLFKKWVFEKRAVIKGELKRQIVDRCFRAVQEIRRQEIVEEIRKKNLPEKESTQLIDAATTRFLHEEEEDNLKYFSRYMEGIKNSLQTRIDSFEVLRKHLSDDNRRTLFKNVKSSKDFERELHSKENVFARTMAVWADRPVMPGEFFMSHSDKHKSVSGSELMQRLGEKSNAF